MPDKKPKIRGNDPNLNTRRRMKGERSIEIGGEQWGWKLIGGEALIFRPDGTKFMTSAYDIDDRQSIGPFDAPLLVTPAMVRSYIERNLIG